MIAVDWGTSSFRAYRLNAAGAIVEKINADIGIMSVTDRRFEEALQNAIGRWTETDGAVPPILMSGMIGSRQGWVEADYIEPPVSLERLADHLTKVTGNMRQPVFIVPGVSVKAGDMPDVMRGEETQIFGAMRRDGFDRGTIILPGTHSKWVQIDNGAIATFKTFMTGEMFAALRGHTILGAFMTERTGINEDAFRRGLAAGRAEGSPGALLHRVFGARTLPLFDLIEPDGVADYLSGLLIGAEFSEGDIRRNGPLSILGASSLAQRYFLAAEHIGLPARLIDPDYTASGLYAIAARAAILSTEPS